MAPFIKTFSGISIKDVPEVGGKNASLGEMFCRLTGRGIRVPDGFAVTAAGFWRFVRANDLELRLQDLLQQLDTDHFANLSAIGDQARQWLLAAHMPDDLAEEITAAYQRLSGDRPSGDAGAAVAVRSSATAMKLQLKVS